jgi:hypothetical protein
MTEPERCFIMLCTHHTERECLGRNLFGDREQRLQYLEAIRPGDMGFLLNTSKNELIGIFKSQSEAQLDIQEDAWNGEFRAQVQVEQLGELKRISEAASVLAEAGIKLIDLPSGTLVPLMPVQEGDCVEKLLKRFREVNLNE